MVPLFWDTLLPLHIVARLHYSRQLYLFWEYPGVKSTKAINEFNEAATIGYQVF